jgi:hypothetical protein
MIINKVHNTISSSRHQNLVPTCCALSLCSLLTMFLWCRYGTIPYLGTVVPYHSGKRKHVGCWIYNLQLQHTSYWMQNMTNDSGGKWHQGTTIEDRMA